MAFAFVGSDRPAITVFTLEPLKEFDPATAGNPLTVQPTDIESSYGSLARELAGGDTAQEEEDAGSDRMPRHARVLNLS